MASSRAGDPWRALVGGLWIPTALAALFSAGLAALFLSVPLYMMQIYDRVLVSGSKETLAALSLALALALIAFFVLDAARSRLLRRAGAWLASEAAPRAIANAERLGANARAAPDAAEDSNERKAPIDPRAPIDVARALASVREAAGSPALAAAFDLAFSPLIVLALALLHPWFAAIALAGAAALAALSILSERLSGPAARRGRAAASEIGRALGAPARGARIAAQGLWPLGRARALDADARASAALTIAGDRSAWIGSASKATRLGVQGCALGVGALLAIEGAVTAGEMIAASIALGRALAPIEQLSAGWTVLREGRRAMKTLARAAGAEAEGAGAPAARIRASEVIVAAPRGGPPVVRAASFELGAGELLAIVGPSGAGKSALIETLAGAQAPDSGSIALGDAAPTKLDHEARRLWLGYAPQRPIACRGTIAELILGAALPAEPSDAELAAARAAAALFGLDREIMRLEAGYGASIEALEPAPPGLLQRIALARAFVRPRKIVLLDDPIALLDIDGAQRVERAIEQARADGAAVVYASARPWLLDRADRVLALDRGRVVHYGPPPEPRPEPPPSARWSGGWNAAASPA